MDKTSTLPAIATLTGLSETTLARLERSGLDQDKMVIIGDIVKFTGADEVVLARFIERGVGLGSLQAASQVHDSCYAARMSSFESLVDLAHGIGEGHTYELGSGMTIYRGNVVTIAEAQRLELIALEAEMTQAGIAKLASSDSVVTAAALIGGSQPTSADQSSPAEPEPKSTQRVTVAEFEAWSAQEKIMLALLETVDEALSGSLDPAADLNTFINEAYDGNVRRAFADLGRDEEGFKWRFQLFTNKQTSGDLLLDNRTEESDDEEAGDDDNDPQRTKSLAEVAEEEDREEE